MSRVELEIDHHIATITLLGSGSENAITLAMLRELDRQLSRVDGDPELWVTILEGGPGNFGGICSDPEAIGTSAIARIHRPIKPVVAAISGNCIEAGLVVVGRYSDIRIAGESAEFGFGEPRSTLRAVAVRSLLHRQIPLAPLMWLALTGQRVGSTEARRFGLVNEVVPDVSVRSRTREVAELLADMAPMSVYAEKKVLIETASAPFVDANFHASAVELLNFLGPDVAEGLAAFVEKRRPQFVGHARRRP